MQWEAPTKDGQKARASFTRKHEEEEEDKEEEVKKSDEPSS